MTTPARFCCPRCGWDSPNHPHGRYCPDCGGRIELIPPLPREDGLSREIMSEGHGHGGWGEGSSNDELRAAYARRSAAKPFEHDADCLWLKGFECNCGRAQEDRA